MKKSRIATFVGFLLLLGLGIYAQLGGFNKITFSMEDKKNVKLYGLTYRGTPQDESMGETFRRIESLIRKNAGADLHTIYYSEPAGKLDTLQVFVGVEFMGTNIPEGLEVKTIPCTKVIVADIQCHKLVMPAPKTVKKELEAFAIENGVTTQGIYVDKILAKDRVKVIAPLE